MKIKTFQFLLSNFAGNYVYGYGYDCEGYTPKKMPNTEKEIDKKLNCWIKKNNPIIHDIKITTYTVKRHNNGLNDTVIGIYTITYDLPEGAEDKESEKEEA